MHSQFSVLQAVSPVGELVSAAKDMGMPALAVTDHGNMMAAFQFVRACNKEGIKPIVGAELNVCRDMNDKSVKDDGYPTVFLAKNKNGYHNLAKLASKAYTDGFYYVPRIDRALVEEYKEDLIVLTGGLFGEVPSLILNVGEAQAEEAFLFWKNLMGADFYAELNRHGLEEETVVNDVLKGLAATHDVKLVASNNSYYTRQDQSDAHDILLCVKDARNVSQPKRYVGKRGREFRFGFPNDSFYLKSPKEMKALFSDVPEAITNIATLVDECEGYVLERDVLLPAFDIPAEFVHEEDAKDGGKRGENAYLRHLTYLGAEKRYEEITDEIRERIDFELETIERTGYPGYFLIVQDFTTAAREMGVSVGPGRGSAAGSAVAYCVGITNVDPIKYDLLFERFLNPDRVSLPDIDIDFDDEGRGKVIDYVIDKYGANQVAQIITYGTMAAKSSIRDTARVMELPLGDADRLAKLVPDISLKKMFSLDDKALKEKVRSEGFAMVEQLKAISTQPTLEGQTLQTARVLEGSVRNTGIHACGVIITPDDITNFVPVATAKDSAMACTQFDNAVAEDAGLLKMDFLGLKTLTVIKDAVKNVKLRHGKDLDPDEFPLDDPKTYELFQRGDTIGIFQYESAGMQKHLKSLQPTVFEDLIAMNALYRPGPMEYIPDFVARKHGRQAITYDLDACQEYLEETYGITVYQEQVMLLSQKLAGFSKGEADSLRKAMGKKKKDIIDKMKPDFMARGTEKGHDAEKLEKIWTDWEAFASYAFNKSHSTCYAWVAYQTAYLKANYPAEFMAAPVVQQHERHQGGHQLDGRGASSGRARAWSRCQRIVLQVHGEQGGGDSLWARRHARRRGRGGDRHRRGALGVALHVALRLCVSRQPEGLQQAGVRGTGLGRRVRQLWAAPRPVLCPGPQGPPIHRVGRSLRRGHPGFGQFGAGLPVWGRRRRHGHSRAAHPRMRNVGVDGPAQQGARHRGRLHLRPPLGQIPSRTRPFVRERVDSHAWTTSSRRRARC